jgi:hypothetical protein
MKNKITEPLEQSDVAVIMCPPLSKYKEQPKDQSKCELFDCPKCKNKMWLSEKKKEVLMFAELLEKEIILACYDCIGIIVMEHPNMFDDHVQVEL